MSTTDITTACKAIQDAWPSIRSDFFALVPGHYLEITCVHRSPAEQFELYKQGRTMSTSGDWIIVDKEKIVTNVDGHKIIGKHNKFPSEAIDVCVVDNQTGKRLWSLIWYDSLIGIAARYGLVSGGSWRSIKDFPHIETKENV